MHITIFESDLSLILVNLIFVESSQLALSRPGDPRPVLSALNNQTASPIVNWLRPIYHLPSPMDEPLSQAKPWDPPLLPTARFVFDWASASSAIPSAEARCNRRQND